MLQEVGRVLVNGDAAAVHQFLPRPAAGHHTHGAEAGLAGTLGVVGRIAERETL